MSTNFFFRTLECGSCQRFDQYHVGKRSSGWSFGFRGYQHSLLNESHPGRGSASESPLGRPIRSRSDWRELFTVVPGTLWDQYGGHQPDPLTWLADLPAPNIQQQHDEDARCRSPWGSQRNSWRDPEGFRFYHGEFC